MAKLSVTEAAATYQGVMRNVLPAGPGVCAVCHTFIGEDYETCLSCARQPSLLDAVVPITYSEHLGQMHNALRNYKDGLPEARSYARARLAAILWRFLELHEGCVAGASGTDGFGIVTTVPSSSPARDKRSSLRVIAKWCRPIKTRLETLLGPTGQVEGRGFDPLRYRALGPVDDDDVLLIDDTWASGGHAQSAAQVLKDAGARRVGLVVISRHLQPEWQITPGGPTSGDAFDALPREFLWETCAVH